MSKTHHYQTHLDWTGNRGAGTIDYRSYDRDHVIRALNKGEIPGSSDPSFRGNPERYNPEELLVASLSSCHMLWFLHLCTTKHVVVTQYEDSAEGWMEEGPDGAGHFTKVVLRPKITVSAPEMIRIAQGLHEEANKMCFIANSVNFPVLHEAEARVG